MAAWRRALTRCGVRLLYGFSIVLGTTAIRFDFARQRVIKSRALSVYVAGVNLLFVLTVPYALYLIYNFTTDLSRNNLLRLMNLTSVTTYVVVAALIVIFCRKRDRLAENLARQLFALDFDYFLKQPRLEAIERRFELTVLLKAATTCGQLASGFFGILQLTRVWPLQVLLRAAYSASMKYMLHGIVFQYYVELAHAARRFDILNAQLSRLLRELCHLQLLPGNEQPHRLATAELRLIQQTHWRLTHLVQRLCSNFDLQTLAVLLTYSLYTINFGYMAFLMADGSLNITPSRAGGALSLLSYVIFFVDLYLLYRNCNATMAAYRRTASVLQQFRALPLLSAELECCSEVFSLQLLQRPLHMNVAGMFALNLQSLLALWAFIIRHTIILVQSELENRLRQP